MKNRLLIIVSVLFISAVFVQCKGDCAKEDCEVVPPMAFSFRLLNNANKDLLVGTAKVYDSANVKVTARTAGNGSIKSIDRFFYYSGDTLALTGFAVDKSNSAYFISINNVITDSVFFGYTLRQTACCDLSYYYLNRFNTTDIPGGLTLPITNGYTIRK